MEYDGGDDDTDERWGRRLSEPPGLALGLEQAEDVVLTDWRGTRVSTVISIPVPFSKSFGFLIGQESCAMTGLRRRRTRALDVADDAAGGVVHELDADLGHTATGAYLQSAKIPQSAMWSSFNFFFCEIMERGGGASRSEAEGREGRRTGAAEDTGDLDELDGNLGAVHGG